MMGTYIIKTPDIGEGIAEVELVAWHVKEGDTVVADQVLADVMTDKATVEIPSPVAGRVLTLGGSIGRAVAVGSELIRLEVEGEGNLKAGAAPAAGTAGPAAQPAQLPAAPVLPTFAVPPPLDAGERVRQAIEAAAAAAAVTQPAAPSNARSLHPPCAGAPGNWASRWSRCVRPVRPGASCRRTWTPMPAPTLAWRHPRPHARRPVRP
jgi:2-oxoisovalerate dehydrogenase E2 component (dihydrolipoyl transacylase)